jgi:hypothetical protein
MGQASLYVYYRVRSADLARARALAALLLETINRRCGVRGRLLARCEEPDLWMEIYEPVADPAAFRAALDQACAQIGFAAVLAPGQFRHCECFLEAQPCA